MILLSAIANITSNLDVIRQQEGKGISSHVKLKEEAMSCLNNLLDKAPLNEYKNLLHSKNCDIILGYLLSILCHLAKEDKSKSVRLHALKVMSILITRLGDYHQGNHSREKCAIRPLILALPGVSSTLFKLVMSDTKLKREFLISAIQTLSKLLEVVFQPCPHQNLEECLGNSSNNEIPFSKLEGEHLDRTCDNLATRISILVEYMMNHSQDLHDEVKLEMTKFIRTLSEKSHSELFKRLFSCVVRYVAYLTSKPDAASESQAEYTELLIENMRETLSSINDDGDSDLDATILNRLFQTLDNLESNGLNMLISERQSELATLLGALRMFSDLNLMTFLEIPHRREQFFSFLTQLTEFSHQQPLLFLTDTHVNEQALELRNERIYTFEKRFLHIIEHEVSLITGCLQLIGQRADWSLVNDILKSDLTSSQNPSHLYMAHHLLEGMSQRRELCRKPRQNTSRFIRQIMLFYLNKIQDNIVTINKELETAYSSDIIRTVIMIETMALIVRLQCLACNYDSSSAECSLILKDLLCPLLIWSSSTSRAISEVSLNTLTKVSLLYGYKSTQAFIKANIDYIVDGVSQMLDNFACNPEVTNVLSITFKLSSIEVFYYFRDVYERVFKLLQAYHYTDRSKSIALLFYRTLQILAEWKKANRNNESSNSSELEQPIQSELSIKKIRDDLSIDLRLQKLRQKKSANKSLIHEHMESMQITKEETNKAIPQENFLRQQDSNSIEESMEEAEESKQDKKPDVLIVLAEKIMKHCIGLMSSGHNETKILALKTAACSFEILQHDEDTLLPLVHQLWSPLMNRLTSDYNQNLEINLCAFDCLVAMAKSAKDFIKKRSLDLIIPRICLFLESQSSQSKCKKDYEPYTMTISYKCQLKLLSNLGLLAYHIQLAHSNLWRIIQVSLRYLEQSQAPSLRQAARTSLHYLLAVDADCVWYFAKQTKQLSELPFELIYESY